MATTNFIDDTTVIVADWLNDVNKTTYQALGLGGVAPSTPDQVINNLSLQVNNATNVITKDGVFEKYGLDPSHVYHGTNSVLTNGDMWSLLGGQFCMEFWLHNVNIDAAGNFLGREDTGACEFYGRAENGYEFRFDAPSDVAGTPPIWALTWYTTPSGFNGSISFPPTGNIAATTVQAAIIELDTEKLSTTTAASTYAPIAGNASQVFSVGDATSADHAVKLEQISLLPTVVSATATDIFGAAGATISIDNSTPITTTSFTACTAAQVGSVKRVIPVQAWSVTASANLVVDGATSGTFVMPAGAKLEVLASTTTLFQLTTISATGTWTPNQGAGLTVVGAFSSSGRWVKTGNQYTLIGLVSGATSVAVSAAGIITSNTPFASGTFAVGGANNASNNVSQTVYMQVSSIYSNGAIAATSGIYFTITGSLI